MSADKIFTVLTEFRFEAGQAIATSGAVQRAVDGISSSADEALLSFQRMGLGVAAQFGLGTGGVLGVLYTAIKASDKFYQSQIKIANLFQSSGFFTGATGFSDAMQASENSLMKMKDIARKFSLPSADLVSTSTLVGASLMAKGLDDASMKKSIDISRQFLKSAPMLGIDPGMATGQLIGAVSGRAELGGNFTQRLLDETKTLQAFSGKGGLAKFNALDAAKRLDLLTRSLAEFGNNTKAAEAIAGSFSGQMRLLGENLTGMFSIFRKFGTMLLQPLLLILNEANKLLTGQFEKIINNIAQIIEPIIKNPKSVLLNLMQARQLKGDVGSAATAMGFGAIIGSIGAGIKMLGGSAKFANPIVASFAVGFSVMAQSIGRAFPMLEPFMKAAAKWGSILSVIASILYYFGVLGTTLTFIGSILIKVGMFVAGVIPQLLLLILIFQTLSRAAAMAQVHDLMAMPDILKRLSEQGVYFSRIFGMVAEPVMQAIDAVAAFISPIFRMSFWANILVDVFEFITEAFVLFVAGFQGIMFAILTIVQNVTDLISGKGGLNIFKGIGDAFAAGTDDIFEKVYGKQDDEGGNAISKKIVNIGTVEINNAFKEQSEPDRIAFTIADQLFKAALNRGQSNGRSLGTAASSQ